MSQAEPAVDLYDDYVPGLTAGPHRLLVQQSVYLTASTKDADGKHYYREQPFVVAGPRYSLPPEDIHATFPPDGATGAYAETLPFIALRKRALPWERLVWGDPGGTTERPPWLALLVLTHEELEVARQTLGAMPVRTGAPQDLFPAGYGSCTGTTVRVGGNALLPCIEPELPGEDTDTSTKVSLLDLPLELFSKVCPAKADLSWLVHTRKVSTATKVPLRMHADGEFSLVLANRFPQPGGNVAFLVSLEGYATLLDALEHGDFKPAADRVRLVVLASWTFVDDELGHHTFGGLMSRLDAGVFGAPPEAAGSGAPANATVAGRLAAGYAPVAHLPAEGDTGFAWYRGPLAAHPVEQISGDAPFTSADQALVLDADSGIFDLSYAVAWQLGRLLGLASTVFADGLRTVLDEYHDERGAFAAVADLQDQLQASIEEFDTLWEKELRAKITVLRAGTLTPDERQQLVDNLTASGLPPAQAEAIVKAFESTTADADDVLAGALTDAGVPQPVIEKIVNLMHRPDQAASPELVAGDALLQWLAQLALLYPVPFSYLVAHERLLPPESLRFFYIDNNWIEALLDGSFSISLECEHDVDALTSGRPAFDAGVSQLVFRYRERLRGIVDPNAATTDSGPGYMNSIKSGFLLRSAAVTGWPGMEVACSGVETLDSGAAQPLTLLRLDHLGPDVLLCVANGKITSVTFTEPAEGLQFSVEGGQAPLRHWTGDRTGTRQESDPKTPVATALRDSSIPGVVNVSVLAEQIKAAAGGASPFEAADAIAAFGSAALALQLAQGQDKQTITWQAPAAGRAQKRGMRP